MYFWKNTILIKRSIRCFPAGSPRQQHNSLYRNNVAPELKKAVQCEWRAFLKGLANRYRKIQNVDEYESDIRNLKKNTEILFCACEIRNPGSVLYLAWGFERNASENLSFMILKHLWCMDKVETPPQCPVDRIILEEAGKRYPETKWGYVNSIDEHRKKIRFLNEAKDRVDNNTTLAEWELKKEIQGITSHRSVRATARRSRASFCNETEDKHGHSPYMYSHRFHLSKGNYYARRTCCIQDNRQD